jgi:hypothetical protein
MPHNWLKYPYAQKRNKMNDFHVAGLCVACFMAGVLVLNFWKVGARKKRRRDDD